MSRADSAQREKERIVRSLASFGAADSPSWTALLAAVETLAAPAPAAAWEALRARCAGLGATLPGAGAEADFRTLSRALDTLEGSPDAAHAVLAGVVRRLGDEAAALRAEAAVWCAGDAESVLAPVLAGPGTAEPLAFIVDARTRIDACRARVRDARERAARAPAAARRRLEGEFEAARDRGPLPALLAARETIDLLRRAEAGTVPAEADLLARAESAARALRVGTADASAAAEASAAPAARDASAPKTTPAVATSPAARAAETALRVRAFDLLQAGRAALARGAPGARRGSADPALAGAVRRLEEAFGGVDGARLAASVSEVERRVPLRQRRRRPFLAAVATLVLAAVALLAAVFLRGPAAAEVMLAIDRPASREVAVLLVAREGGGSVRATIPAGAREVGVRLAPGVYDTFLDGGYTGCPVVVPGPTQVPLGPVLAD